MVIFGFRGPNYPRVGGFWGFWGIVIRGNTVLWVYTNTQYTNTIVYMLYSMHVTYAIHMYTYIYICGHVWARTPPSPQVTSLPQYPPLSLLLRTKQNTDSRTVLKQRSMLELNFLHQKSDMQLTAAAQIGGFSMKLRTLRLRAGQQFEFKDKL